MNILKYLVFAAAMQPIWASAQFFKLMNGLIQSNYEINAASIEKEKSFNSVGIVDAQTNFFLAGELGYTIGKAPNLFSNFSQESVNETASLTLTKAFSWGGTFSLGHMNEIQDISKWPASFITQLGGDKAYYVTNSLTYSQDLGKNLFGNNFQSQLTQAELAAELAAISFSQIEEDVLLRSFQAYLKVKLDKKMFEISEQFLKRAEKRKKLLEKKFKDGVVIRADYYRSENAYNRAEEIYRDSTTSFNNSFNTLKELVGFEIDENLILEFENHQQIKIPNFQENLIANKKIEIIQKKLILAQEALEGFKVRDNYDLTLDFGFSRTSLKNKYRDALTSSFEEDDFENKSVSLNIVIPLGKSGDGIEKINKTLDLKKAELERKDIIQKIKKSDYLFRDELKKTEENLISSKKRLSLEKKILEEQNNRYNRGQIDFDQVLSAEESLLDTEKSYFQYFSKVLILKTVINQIYGNLMPSLESYRE